MTKYTVAGRRSSSKVEKHTDPIWRGIGCLMIAFVPFMSWFFATLLMQAAVDNEWPLPYQLMGYPVVPANLWKVAALAPVWSFIQSQANLYGILLFTVLFIVVIGALVSAAYAIIYRYAGPPVYGPLDAPPMKTSVKKYKR